MTPEQFELLYILKNQETPFGERFGSARVIGKEALFRRIESVDLPLFYTPMVDFWRNLGLNKIDRNNEKLFAIRKELASTCWRLSLLLPGGRKFFKYFPKVNKAEGFEERVSHKLKKGQLKSGYGTSLYEFHWEYPIEGFGIRKDLITVITKDNERIPMLDWCKQNDIIVYCNRCGLDITYEVSRDCPFTKYRFKKD